MAFMLLRIQETEIEIGMKRIEILSTLSATNDPAG